jgi:hypothetical protein
MESYSHFFQTLHDERSPTGHLGNGTHASILRAIVFHDWSLMPVGRGKATDVAVIWDEDHDTRVIKAIEAIYRAGFLGSILMIGERKGTLNAIVSEHVKNPKLLSVLEDKLRAVAEQMEGDPWLSSLRTLDDPNHEIIDDDNAKVSLYLANLKMLWRLGVTKVTMKPASGRVGERAFTTLRNLTPEQLDAIVKSIPAEGEKITVACVEAFWLAVEQVGAQNQTKAHTTEEDLAKPAPKIRLVEG